MSALIWVVGDSGRSAENLKPSCHKIDDICRVAFYAVEIKGKNILGMLIAFLMVER